MHDGVRVEVPHHLVHEGGVAEIADVLVQPEAAQLLPARHADIQGMNGDQAVHPEFHVVLAPDEVVRHPHVMSGCREMQGRGPTEVAVTTEDQDAHA